MFSGYLLPNEANLKYQPNYNTIAKVSPQHNLRPMQKAYSELRGQNRYMVKRIKSASKNTNMNFITLENLGLDAAQLNSVHNEQLRNKSFFNATTSQNYQVGPTKRSNNETLSQDG